MMFDFFKKTKGYLSTQIIFVNVSEIDRSPITGKMKHLLDLRVKE